MTEGERACISMLKIEHVVVAESNKDSELNFAQRILKKRRTQEDDGKVVYKDLSFILPASTICERFFSKAGYSMNDRRQGILPANF